MPGPTSARADDGPAGTGLLLPDERGAETPTLRRLSTLRRAEAWRLLRGHAQVGDRRIARALADLARRAPDDAVSVLLDPIPAMFARLDRPHDAGDAWALELARRGLALAPHRVQGRRLVSVRLGVSLTWPADAHVTVLPDMLSIGGDRCTPRQVALDPEALRALDDPALTVTPAFVELAPGIRFGRVDPNPDAHLEAHPDKQGNAVSLGGQDPAAWTFALEGALALIRRHLPIVVDEMALSSFVLFPVGHDPVKHLSASYREYVGACYLTLHPNLPTMAEAMVHEFQHNKANLASYHDALLENPAGTLVRSPVRPDPRPIWGVLLAVHAFVAVAELYRRMSASGDGSVRERLGDVIARNDEGLRTLRQHARPTRIGAALLEELEGLHAEHLALALPGPAAAAWEG